MDKNEIKALLQQVESGNLPVDDAYDKLKSLPYEDLGFAKIDTHRELRRGFPEVIFCEGKTTEQVEQIAYHMSRQSRLVLGMRASQELYEAVAKSVDNVSYNADARAIIIGEIGPPKYKGKISIVSAGTADIPTAEEAALTAQAMGNKIERIYDAGVAGVHRILQNKEKFETANVIVVVAGMEGALPGVVGGLIDKPVIAVPTSVGYGASFNGLSALLTMLNSCVPGIGVVNIDNGFGAGYLASLINRLGG